jgi:signal transduction histidine kinase
VLAAQKERDIELAKDELLSLASHQLRTPATGVKQYVGMVLQGFAGKVPPQQKKLLEKAYASNDRQLQSINEILHLAKISAGHIVLARQNVNITAMIKDVVQEQQQDINSAKHSVKLSLGRKPVWLHVDPHMLRMATENILSNAIKYTPQNGKISVQMRTTDNDVEIRVKDSGIGIREEDFPKLFKQFSRLPNAVSQQTSGTGVGLYLAKYLVESHNGSIDVTSEQHKGSTFIIRLPVKPNIEEV